MGIKGDRALPVPPSPLLLSIGSSSITFFKV